MTALGIPNKFEGYHDLQTLPIKRGMVVTISKGTMVKSHKGSKPAGKTYQVKVDHILPGCNAHRTYHGEERAAENPKVRWPGSGGYWSECDINDLVETHADPEGMLI